MATKIEKNDITFTAHAKEMLVVRNISENWVLNALNFPERREVDPNDPELIHVLRATPENGNRVLRVVYNDHVRPKRIVTMYFDRTVKGEL